MHSLFATVAFAGAGCAAPWGDQGDGTFRNPILPADYSDIDAIRVGQDYYAISSTFQYSPGMVILHSKDFVNWRILGHAVGDLTQISPEMNWDRMSRNGRGVWAGSLRFHAGKFWLYFGTPDDGYFMTTARNPAGPWDPLACVMKASGWDDCCPFWDDDGQGYLVGTRFAADSGNGKRYKIHLFKLTSDGKTLVSGFDKILYQSQGSEANKLYKWNGLYYHFFSEVHREGRVTMIRRSATLTGPAEIQQLNHVNKTVDREPNQGGIVQTAAGDWWFVTHQGAAHGRAARSACCRYVARRLADHRPARRRRHRQHGLAGEETARGPARGPAANVRYFRRSDAGAAVGMELPAEGRKVVAHGPPRLAASAGIPPTGTGKPAQGRQHRHAKDFRRRRRSDGQTGRCAHGRRSSGGPLPL